MRSVIQIAELDDELRMSRALQKALSASGLEGVARSNALSALQHLDGPALEAVLLFMMLAVSGDVDERGLAIRGNPAGGIMTALPIPELAARIGTAARNTELLQSEAIAERISVREIALDPIRRTVMKRGQLIYLTPKEFDLLHYLMARAGIPVRHAELLRKLWGVEYAQELEYLRTYIYHLRKKLEDNPTIPRYLLTESCYGYRFAESEARVTDPMPIDAARKPFLMRNLHGS
jgi:two-component system KDP operon response regulator KdpE